MLSASSMHATLSAAGQVNSTSFATSEDFFLLLRSSKIYLERKINIEFMLRNT
jgi:hypothetical protein